MNFFSKKSILGGIFLIILLTGGLFFYHQKIKTEDKAKNLQANINLVAQKPVKVYILTYHNIKSHKDGDKLLGRIYNVEPEIFAEQMQYLKDNGYNVISFDSLVNDIKNNIQMPDKPVVITFDDGWQSQYQNAYPVLKKYNYPATFFIFTNAIGRNNERYLNWDQVKEMSENGMIIGSHSKFHPLLFKETNPETLKKEIKESKEIIEYRIGKPVNYFAYPFGKYSPQEVEEVKQSGYQAARSLFGNDMEDKNNLFTLNSILAPVDMKLFERAMH